MQRLHNSHVFPGYELLVPRAGDWPDECRCGWAEVVLNKRAVLKPDSDWVAFAVMD